MFDYIVQRGKLSEGEASNMVRQVVSCLSIECWGSLKDLMSVLPYTDVLWILFFCRLLQVWHTCMIWEWYTEISSLRISY